MQGTLLENAGRSLIRFFIATFALTWACFFAADRVTRGHAAVLMLGVFAPSIVAIALTFRSEGRAGVASLLRRLLMWRVPLRFYVFALGYLAAIKGTVALLHRVATGRWPAFGTTPWYVMLAATFISVAIGGQTGEEIGWRGYALPRLAHSIGLPAGSLLLGLIWALWHLPLFFMQGTTTTGQSFPLYLMQVTALSTAFAWLWMRTGGSLLPVMLLHAAINNTKDIVPSAVEGGHDVFAPSTSLPAWLTVALLWIGAAYFLAACARANGRA